jgi:hypothetical protein
VAYIDSFAQSCPNDSMAVSGSRHDADELRHISQSMMDAIAIGDTATWSHYLASDAVLTDEEANVRDRAATLENLKPLPRGYSGWICVESPRVTIHGDASVITYAVMETESVLGQTLHTHFYTTDTYIREFGQWRLLGSQTGVIPSEHTATAVSPGLLNDYVGRYTLAPGADYVVTRDGDRLFGQRTGHAKEEMLPLGVDRFFRTGAVRGERVFRRDANGRVDAMLDRRDNNDLVWRRVQ